MEFLIALSIPVLAAVVAGLAAGRKNRSRAGWAIGTFLFVPVLLVLLFLPTRPGDETTAAPA